MPNHRHRLHQLERRHCHRPKGEQTLEHYVSESGTPMVTLFQDGVPIKSYSAELVNNGGWFTWGDEEKTS
jgi:hypothetical protein